MKNKKGIIIGGVILAIILAVFVLIFVMNKPATDTGNKTITVKVIQSDKSENIYTIKTNAEFLGEALIDENLIEGTNSDFGLFVTTVEGITANDANEEWWCFTKGGEDLFTGADTTPIADGDIFEITLTIGYEW